MTLSPAPLPTPHGTPIDGLDFGEAMLRTRLTHTLLMVGGVSTQMANLIAQETGDAIAWPFATVGFLDEEQRPLALAIHYGGIRDEAEVSIGTAELPLTRRVLRILAERLFVECGLTAVTVRARPQDDTLHWTLQRLGFVTSGRDDRLGAAARLVFTLTADVALRRAFPRGVVPHGDLC